MPRKKPFSTKQKKRQLQDRRERKRGPSDLGRSDSNSRSQSRERGEENTDTSDSESIRPQVRRLNQQPLAPRGRERGYDPNRYRLHFERESKEEVERRKKIAQDKVLDPIPEAELEVDISEIYRPGSVLDFPKRPAWNYDMSKEAVLSQEERAFKDYLQKIYENHNPQELSYFEHNIETWRQLWRVLEMSDIILLITDIRHPVLHFSPALYEYVTQELGRSLVLVLNKVDLAPPSLVAAWKHYFQSKFPQVHVICFTSYPRHPEEEQNPCSVFKKRRKKRRVWSAALGPSQLLRACEIITAGKVDLASWREKIERDSTALNYEEDDDETDERDAGDPVLSQQVADAELGTPSRELYKDGVLSIGCVGFPNVGKSSVINGLVGKKIVSVSRTPGHTKYFQTYFLTPSVRLCDCPGLIFPSLIDRQQQILSGIHPIAQIQEPYTSVGYLSCRIPVPQLLKLSLPAELKEGWTAWGICEAWADKRGYKTAKASRSDTYRAANSLLRLAVDGRLCLCMRPPGYTQQKDAWERHPETQEMAAHSQAQGRSSSGSSDEEEEEEISSSGEEEEERDRDADEEEEEETPTQPHPKKTIKNKLATTNPYALLGEDEC
ncbi:guanine nucleotide-binding protein-like 1 [Bombina bombina]|uniref:guanine nucleotide-binding protein-like 1 n=1 Tax=Bombina bombina TaxID=8345 RepID=UPI00235A6C8F|nr:guanine nucleotide-binding protein-like 1 [Bombina bombina]XP_053578019.1 guanine nucleotide-binding protein-like 1 [Bombina bombina]